MQRFESLEFFVIIMPNFFRITVKTTACYEVNVVTSLVLYQEKLANRVNPEVQVSKVLPEQQGPLDKLDH